LDEKSLFWNETAAGDVFASFLVFFCVHSSDFFYKTSRIFIKINNIINQIIL
jgi:hypothetical protein